MITSIGRCIPALLALSLYLATDSTEAKSFPVLFGWDGETIRKVVDFPDTPEFQVKVEGRGTVFLDAGAIYKTVTVFFLPLWNYDIRWVGYMSSDESFTQRIIDMQGEYLSYTRDELQEIASYANIKLPQSPSLSFWYSYGGKLVLLSIIIVFIMIQKIR